MQRWLVRGALGAAAAGVLAAMGLLAAGRAAPRLADADDAALVQRGRHLYAARCAGCHGRRLQGQALWQADGPGSDRRAPALDQTGHGWLHDDAALIRIVERGRFGDSAEGAPQAMPAFGPSLGARDTLAVVAFVKASWPIGLRVAQARLNPGSAGMPHRAAGDWTFPAMCSPEIAAASGRAGR